MLSVVEVDIDNFEVIWPKLQDAMRNAAFVSLDTEMSGLGSNSHNFHSNADDRYTALRSAAETRSLISLGVSCFIPILEENESEDSDTEDKINYDNKIRYHAKVYNILLLCSDSFTIDPSAVSFLVKHGFDFNLQFSKGLKYKKGDFSVNDSQISARNIFNELIKVRKPVILHNGFADLVFLYQCFYASCPKKLSTFLADVCEMFPSGIYDTKVIAHIHEKFASTFLEYVSKSYQLLNHRLSTKNRPHILLSVGEGNSNIEEFIGPTPVIPSTSIISTEWKDIKVCTNFAKYGWCKKAEKCEFSHDIGDIIAKELFENKKKRRRMKPSEKDKKIESEVANHGENITKKIKINADAQCLNAKVGNASNGKILQQTACHRAGLDSLLTGYSFAVFTIAHMDKLKSMDSPVTNSSNSFSSVIPHLSESYRANILNKLYLNSKSITLWITKSHFSKTSSKHEENFLRIFLE